MKTFIAILTMIFTLLLPVQAQEKLTIIVDADTANEVDDLFAVTRALIEPTWNVTALNATQWQASHWGVADSMEQSHRLNQMIAGYLGTDVKTRRGGLMRMYDWGDQAQHSAAAYEIIKQAHQLEDGQKLTVVALGALTNVASAIFIDPSIEPKLSLYWLGSNISFNTQQVTHDDFNCMMDVHAYYKIMNSDVELTIMPLGVAHSLQFKFEHTKNQLQNVHPLADFLVERWVHHIDPLRHKRTVWDLALITAMINPNLAKQEKITLKGEFEGKVVNYFTSIEADKIEADFYHTFKKYIKNI